MKLYNILIFSVFMAVLTMVSKADDVDVNDWGIDFPDTKPSVAEDVQMAFKLNKKYAMFFALRGEAEKLFKERERLRAPADDREMKRNQSQVEKIEKRIVSAKKRFYREARKLRAPVDRDYKKVKDTYDALEDKAAKLEEAEKDAQALKMHQEATKWTGKLETLKSEQDCINFFLYFDEFEADGTVVVKKAEKDDGDGEKPKKDKPKKSKKNKEKKAKPDKTKKDKAE